MARDRYNAISTGPQLDETTLAFAARGFIQSLSESQRDTFMSLFASNCDAEKAMTCSKEQANFELGHAKEPSSAAGLISAIRYAMPRQTYASGSVAGAVKRHWPHLTPEDQKRVHAVVVEGLSKHHSTSSEDRRVWIEVANLYEVEKREVSNPTHFAP